MTSTFGDLGSAVVIIFIFSILHAVLAVSIGISNIKNNWEYYKCNPSKTKQKEQNQELVLLNGMTT